MHSKTPDMESDGRIEVSCMLTQPELQERKTRVLASLRQKITEIKELSDGFTFAFNGEDGIIDELIEFIKSERQCCPFFTFNLLVKNENNGVWLSITGPKGTKEFIQAETGLALI